MTTYSVQLRKVNTYGLHALYHANGAISKVIVDLTWVLFSVPPHTMVVGREHPSLKAIETHPKGCTMDHYI